MPTKKITYRVVDPNRPKPEVEGPGGCALRLHSRVDGQLHSGSVAFVPLNAVIGGGMEYIAMLDLESIKRGGTVVSGPLLMDSESTGEAGVIVKATDQMWDVELSRLYVLAIPMDPVAVDFSEEA